MAHRKRSPMWLPALAATAAAAVGWGAAAQAQTPQRPNVLVIVADDLGFSDIAPFGGEIRTPNLQALADRGVRLTGFHTAPTCSPTRAMLLTGADNHEVGLGSMAEAIARTPVLQGRPGYEGHLNGRAATLPHRLQAAGYMTLMAGKWHLGLTEATSPRAQGFDRSFALLQGGHDHYGDDQTKTYAEAGVGATYRKDGELTTYPVGEYSADVFTSRMIDYLGEAKASDKPFFAYLTFTQPHWPLQAPPEDIARYEGRYADGYEALRQRRLRRMKELGLTAEDVQASGFIGVKPWAGLTLAERAIASRKMEIYAAMVDRMDQNIGRVMAALETNGQLENTVVIFLSDNGPEPSALDGPIGMKGPVESVALGLDNSLKNLGRRHSFAAYGPGWAQAASAPSRQAKGSTFEGGIRTPAIVAGPGVKGSGRIADAPLHVMDLAPTVLTLAGVSPRAVKSDLPIRGKSWKRLLRGAPAVHSPREVMAWELFFQRAVRRGDWKAVYAPALPLDAHRPMTPVRSEWALFNIKDDPGETRNLATVRPEVLKAMIAAWDAYAARVGVVIPPAR